MARYRRVTWSPSGWLLASDRLTPDQRGRVSNSDVPGPYRQDAAGDYGSAEFGIGRSAGYGRSGAGRGGGRGAGGRGDDSGRTDSGAAGNGAAGNGAAGYGRAGDARRGTRHAARRRRRNRPDPHPGGAP